MHYCPFVTDERPHCLWGWELPAENLAFLDGIDPDYFRHVAELLHSQLSGDERQYAALSLRQGYAQALETLFALLAAAVQAPACPVGWILKYQNKELRSVVRKITAGEPVLTRLPEPITWEFVAMSVLPSGLPDQERLDRIKRRFGELWRDFARDFLNDDVVDEYNSIKHGFRVRPGGFMLSVGVPEKEGEPPPPEKMTEPTGSEFGSSYFAAEPIGKDRINFQLSHTWLDWHPDNLATSLALFSISIKNVVAFLKVAGGRSPAEVQVQWPTEDEAFDLPWGKRLPWTRFRKNPSVRPGDIGPLSKADVFAAYSAPGGTPPGGAAHAS